MMVGEKVKVGNMEIEIEKFIGKGKSGYSYLGADIKGRKYVVKKIHDEPCPSYTFGDKFQSEIDAYEKLKDLIKIPEMICYSKEEEIIVKEYIEGDVMSSIIAGNGVEQTHIDSIIEMTKVLYPQKINIDYFPSNFVTGNGEVYYIDYEVNGYMDEWNFENWGIYFFANPNGMKKYIETGEVDEMLISAESGKPIKNGFEERVKKWLEG